jgi:hypothetical protein
LTWHYEERTEVILRGRTARSADRLTERPRRPKRPSSVTTAARRIVDLQQAIAAEESRRRQAAEQQRIARAGEIEKLMFDVCPESELIPVSLSSGRAPGGGMGETEYRARQIQTSLR